MHQLDIFLWLFQKRSQRNYITTSKVLQSWQTINNAVRPNLVSMQNFGFNLQPRSRCSSWAPPSRICNTSRLIWNDEPVISVVLLRIPPANMMSVFMEIWGKVRSRKFLNKQIISSLARKELRNMVVITQSVAKPGIFPSRVKNNHRLFEKLHLKMLKKVYHKGI